MFITKVVKLHKKDKRNTLSILKTAFVFLIIYY